jgi:hypothetical protein
MLEFFAEKIVERVAGEPNSLRWAYITALFGWSAGIALLASIVTTALGFSALASHLMAGAMFFLPIALSLDWNRVIKR